MGYCISLTDATFRIDAGRTADALAAVRTLMADNSKPRHGGSSSGETWFSWMNGARPDEWKTLADAMEEWRYPVELDAEGNVIDIAFYGEKIGQEDLLFQALAPFVTPGSYLVMQGEDGAIWRWYFDGAECIEQPAQVTFG